MDNAKTETLLFQELIEENPKLEVVLKRLREYQRLLPLIEEPSVEQSILWEMSLYYSVIPDWVLKYVGLL